MVSKCANPGCSAPFLYMRQGKLFRIETHKTENIKGAGFGMDPNGRRAHHPEFFWLCDECAKSMTITRQPGQGVVVQTLARNAAAAAL